MITNNYDLDFISKELVYTDSYDYQKIEQWRRNRNIDAVYVGSMRMKYSIWYIGNQKDRLLFMLKWGETL